LDFDKEITEYHISEPGVAFAWGTFAMVPLFLRAFHGHLKRPFMVPFLAVLAIVHGLIFMILMKWRVPFVYWFPIFIVELSVGAWAAGTVSIMWCLYPTIF